MIKLKRGFETLSCKEIYVDYFLSKGYELIKVVEGEEEEITAVLKPAKKKTALSIPAVEAIADIVSDEEVGNNDDSKGDKS